MNKLQVRMVHLEPMRVACINGFGQGPEHLAWAKMRSWIKAKGLMTDGKAHRYFGYNNPEPSAGSPNYGYDVWATVDDSVKIDGDAREILFPGGFYAVTHCKGVENIFPTWQELFRWRENSPYKSASYQWLEEHLSPLEGISDDQLELDLYLPVMK